MATLTKYDPKQVVFTWDGITISTDIAAGTFITVTRNGDRNSLNVGADGNGTKVVNNDRSTVVAVTVRKSGTVNALLADRLNDEERDPPIDHTGPGSIKDFSGADKFTAAKMFLVNFPDSDYADDETNREWRFMALEMTMDPRGSLEL